ncbi:MAG: DNA polymerase III subunit [Clostridia bacterium]|nr:DNA polymerase III subunit [Clostridia bacterium]
MLTDSAADALRNLSRLFCGNRETVTALAEMTAEGRMPHAWILEGADGLGKSTFARLIAQGAMCTCPQPWAGECSHCRKVRSGIHPDLTVVTGSGKINAISIDAVRKVRTDAYIAPNEADKRVFVLEDCDNMQSAAQNAFLKLFEEAPPKAVFVMTCRSAMHLLETIRSRGRMVTLCPVKPEEGAAFLCRLHPAWDIAETAEVCGKNGGNLGETLRALQPADRDGTEDADALADTLTREIVTAMCGGSELTLAAACGHIGRDRLLAARVCVRLSEALRRALTVSVGAQDTLEHPDAEVLRLGTLIPPAALMKQIEEIQTLSDWLGININMPLFSTRLAIVLQRR